MESVLEYIMSNYTWFLGGAILILLAIIGRYADKTNFGQGKETKENEEINLEELKEESDIQVSVDSKQETNEQDNLVVESKSNANLIETSESVQSNNFNVQVDKKTNFEDKFKEFDKEFDELVPKKGIVNDELLDEIESLSFDKTQ